eukprot:TRINITY_DN11458_c0_g1_i1.p1 TRINITY_DN11458_c0_g1~~TRINITY_DN11458_c0_g1_i1.p1  ORF type:complete len:1176 (+),score=294.66 TRINITY_DN11458_c0_g1_i1:182-3709(+)
MGRPAMRDADVLAPGAASNLDLQDKLAASPCGRKGTTSRSSCHSPSPRTCRLLGEVGACADGLEVLQHTMGGLRQELRRSDFGGATSGWKPRPIPQVPLDAAYLGLEDDVQGEDPSVLEAQSAMEAYFSRRPTSGAASLPGRGSARAGAFDALAEAAMQAAAGGSPGGALWQSSKPAVVAPPGALESYLPTAAAAASAPQQGRRRQPTVTFDGSADFPASQSVVAYWRGGAVSSTAEPQAVEENCVTFVICLDDCAMANFDARRQYEYCHHVADNLHCDRVEIVSMRNGSVVVEARAVGFAQEPEAKEAVGKICGGEAVDVHAWGKYHLIDAPRLSRRFHLPSLWLQEQRGSSASASAVQAASKSPRGHRLPGRQRLESPPPSDRACYVAAALAPPDCDCDQVPLLAKAKALTALVQRRAAEVRELQAEARFQTHAAPDLAAVTGETASLARRNQETAKRVAQLRAEGAALAWAADADRSRAEDLLQERSRLLDALGREQRKEAEAQSSREAAEKALDHERRRLRDRALAHGSKMEALDARIDEARRQQLEAEAECHGLELQTAEAGAFASVEARAATLEVDRRRGRQRELEARIAEEEEKSAVKSRRIEVRCAALGNELNAARHEAAEARSAEETVAALLQVSRQREEDTEARALGVARELVDASQVIAWLRAELVRQSTVRSELHESQARIGMLRQRLLEVPQPAAAVPAAPVRAAATADVEQADDSHNVAALNEALRAAWEAEAKSHREAKQRFENLQAILQPTEQHLCRLSEIARKWRSSLTDVPDATARDGDSAGDKHLPEPPQPVDLTTCSYSRGGSLEASNIMLDQSMLSSTSSGLGPAAFGEALCTCVEALVNESSRRLGEAEALRQRQATAQAAASAVAAAARRGASEGRLLEMERSALLRELERCSSSPRDGATATLVTSAASARSSTSVVTAAARESACGWRADGDQAGAGASAQPAVAQDASSSFAWPASPVPKTRDLGTAGLSTLARMARLRGAAATGGVATTAAGLSSSVLSSVSLHDQNVSAVAAANSGSLLPVDTAKQQEPQSVLAVAQQPSPNPRQLLQRPRPAATLLASSVTAPRPRSLSGADRRQASAEPRRGIRQIPVVARSRASSAHSPQIARLAREVHRRVASAGFGLRINSEDTQSERFDADSVHRPGGPVL